MKSLLILFGCVAGSCFGQQAAQAFWGTWNLDVAKSKFVPGNAPKGQQVIINQNGYVATTYSSVGEPDTRAVAFVGQGCYLIGPPAGTHHGHALTIRKIRIVHAGILSRAKP